MLVMQVQHKFIFTPSAGKAAEKQIKCQVQD